MTNLVFKLDTHKIIVLIHSYTGLQKILKIHVQNYILNSLIITVLKILFDTKNIKIRLLV